MRGSRYTLDGRDHLQSVDEGWSAFARGNDAERLAEDVIGTPLWSWVAGPEVRHIYEVLFAKVRASRRSVRVPFRCDSAGLRRFMELEISALPDDGLLCDAQLLREEPRAPVPLLAPAEPRSDDLVPMCSWCKRVRTADDDWLEIERATRTLRLLEDPPPGITHTICIGCEALIADLG